MAANKFATILHKNCHKIVVILVYAVLEWILILLLLLNSLFSHLISKFANFFGLKPSCPWCSRLDHVLGSKSHADSHRGLVCEAHGAEISRLSYCRSHRRLAESKYLCGDCSFPRPAHDEKINEISSTIAFFTCAVEGISENGENRCSCCDEILSRKVQSSALLFKPSWDVLDYIHKRASFAEVIGEENDGEQASETTIQSKSSAQADQKRGDENGGQGAFEKENQMDFDGSKKAEFVEDYSCWPGNFQCEIQECEFTYQSTDDPLSLGYNEDDESLYITDMLLQNAENVESDGFICIELIDSAAGASQEPLENSMEDVEEHEDKQVQPVEVGKDLSDGATNERYELRESLDMDNIGRSSGLMNEYKTRDEDVEECKQLFFDAAVATPGWEKDDAGAEGIEELDNFPESEQKDYNMLSVEAKSKITCPELDDCAQDVVVANGHSEGHESNEQEKQAEEENYSPEGTIADGLHQLLKKLIMFEKMGSGVEDSLDGSLISEMEVDYEYLNIEHLKTRLRAQQKALNALYAELEEERKAAAVAANETMAMITKLQEDKAAMQMEALQYQRMMEEQSEYDQEALQLLNDLMIKREKEKQELEKELEIYRNKVLEFETREKMMMVRRRKGSVRSTTSTVSIDLNCEGECDDSGFDTHQEHDLADTLEDLEETGVECIANMTVPDISLAEFDEERLSILEELKILEAKLFALHDDEMVPSDDVRSERRSLDTPTDDVDGESHFERRTVDLMAKKLLPLFDAADNEFAQEESEKWENTHLINQFSNRTELANSKFFIQEELGHVYDRLQALEADKEFLRHCIGSMMKGNKGLALLQEILQHLRDLRSVELSARDFAESPLADAPRAKEE